MKGIKFLYGFIIVLGLLVIIRLMHIVIYIPFEYKLETILTTTPILFFIGLIYVERGFFHTIKKGYFNIKSIVKFKKGGLFFVFSGLISLIKSIFLLFELNKSNEVVISNILAYKNLSQSLLLLVIGIGFVVISDFIRKGTLLKQENDLTI